MSKRSRVVFTILGVLALSTAAHADMMPVARLGPGNLQPPCTEGRTALQDASSSSLCLGWPIAAGLDSLPVESPFKTNADAGQASETRPLQVLGDDQSSLSLCLYALMGFGLCRSAPWVKKLSIGCIPDWYHHGGPCQIGHSYAISPDCLCDAPVCCFVQPDCGADDHIPQYLFATVISLWRRSQFTPAVLASRGPPFCSSC